jgi:hypothetical protein
VECFLPSSSPSSEIFCPSHFLIFSWHFVVVDGLDAVDVVVIISGA